MFIIFIHYICSLCSLIIANQGDPYHIYQVFWKTQLLTFCTLYNIGNSSRDFTFWLLSYWLGPAQVNARTFPERCITTGHAIRCSISHHYFKRQPNFQSFTPLLQVAISLFTPLNQQLTIPHDEPLCPYRQQLRTTPP